MREFWKRIIAQGLVVCYFMMIVGMAKASQTDVAKAQTSDEAVGAQSTVTDAEPAVGDETIVEDYEQGYWFYESVSSGVRIEIKRFEDTEVPVIWYEADLQFTEQSPLEFLTANEEAPGKGFYYPERLIRLNKAVFGINDDQFGHRVYNHDTTGVIIRNGEILYSKTKKNDNLSWPTLDTAAFFPDGTMRVFQSSDLTADEYLTMGATTVLSFGPYLVRDGEINPLLKSNFQSREPRSAIGMISPYHFVVLSVEGRIKRSGGVNVEWLADHMQTLGATEALNLDGGKTSCILFMGKKLEISNPEGTVRSGRSVSGMIALGTSEQVPEYTGVE